jgi:hypothetical protein
MPNEYCAYKELLECVTKKGIPNCGHCDIYPCGIVKRMFGKMEKWKIELRNKCDKAVYEMLISAFGEKRSNLDRIFKNMHGKNPVAE